MFRFIRIALSDFADLLFPTLCLGCTRSLTANEKILCTRCRINLPETGQHRRADDDHILNKFAGKVPIQFVASYLHFSKGGIVQKLIHRIKYKGQKEAAREMALWYGDLLKREGSKLPELDLLISVPMSKARLQQRGFNQAEWIAAGLSEALAVPMQADILVRKRFRSSQTRKNRIERWENVKNEFVVRQADVIQGLRVALVDDVLTTGATLEACAVALLQAGCSSVSVLTLAATR
ncbi:ComF family protein [Spirosoma sordidisoli]|uniref:ComF family protein n=1 Tax=Spirosoma sordidisoli TaxID=2502893 RepID=A0A4Q2UKT8_9BACT|nr:phosphoribosyltransferase family protein [Spirosoma sordidisoli]RYC68261.1 ComF family protein [Spirosoma sordidisoli]